MPGLNQACRYHFAKFINQTIIAQPVPQKMSDEEKNMIYEKQNIISAQLKKY